MHWNKRRMDAQFPCLTRSHVAAHCVPTSFVARPPSAVHAPHRPAAPPSRASSVRVWVPAVPQNAVT